MFEKFIAWCAKDTSAARLERTIVQGIISAFVVAFPQMMQVVTLPEWVTAFAVAVGMAILSPIMKAIGNKGVVSEPAVEEAAE